MSHYININSKEVIRFTNRLEKMHRSALPLAVRGTLNRAAFYTKQSSMPASAEKHFKKRKPNFFKANSRVKMATGYDVSRMQSIVGFISSNLSHNHYAVTELEEQEFGGDISHRTFVPLDGARKGGNATPVRPGNRLAKIKNIVNMAKGTQGSDAAKFTVAAQIAGRGGYVVGGMGSQILYRIKNIIKRGDKTIIRKTPLYSFEEGRSVGIEAQGFMLEATKRSASKMMSMYKLEARRQIRRLLVK